MGTLELGDQMGPSYRELVAWQKAMQFVVAVYKVTEQLPDQEKYGLCAQLRQAAVFSVPSNIAEGQARYSQKEFVHFLSHARGSLVEIETQLMIARELAYLHQDRVDTLLRDSSELGRLISALANAIKQRCKNRKPKTEN